MAAHYSPADFDRWFRGNLPFRPLGDALDDVPDEPPSLVEGLVVKGLIAALAGVPKVGKSTLVFGMVKAIRTGLPFLGRPTTHGGALLLTEEQTLTLNEKRQIFSLNRDDMHVLMRYEAGNDWPETVGNAVRYCVEQGLELLVIDPWDKWAMFGTGEENDSGAQLARLQPLHEATANGIAVLICAHQAKHGGIRGSNAFSGAVDVILELEHAEEGRRILRGASRLRSTPERLYVDWDPWTGAFSTTLPRTIMGCDEAWGGY